jgi:hypothetical protein
VPTNGSIAAWRRAAVLALALLLTSATAGIALALPSLDQPLTLPDRCPGPGESTLHVTIAATGDTFPHENIQQVGAAQGFDVLFDGVRPFLRAADLAYTNLDVAMLRGGGYTGYPLFNVSPELAPALRAAGIDVVSTANNHILDRGPEGIDATLDVLDAAGLAHHCAMRTDAAERPPFERLEVERDGTTLSVGFISATWGTNGNPDPFDQVNLLFTTNDYGQQGRVRPDVLAAIRQADRETDLVVVAAHFGFEYEFYPARSQVQAARRMAAAGADVILGAQPHTLQPVDVIELDGRQTWVFYSLANFLASQGWAQEQYFAATSAIIYVEAALDPRGEAIVTGYRYLPTIHVENDTRPVPIRPGMADDALTHVRTLMRDPTGQRQVSATAPPRGERITICPPPSPADPAPTPVSAPVEPSPTTEATPSASPLVDTPHQQAEAAGAPPQELPWLAAAAVGLVAGSAAVLAGLRRRVRGRGGT